MMKLNLGEALNDTANRCLGEVSQWWQNGVEMNEFICYSNHCSH